MQLLFRYYFGIEGILNGLKKFLEDAFPDTAIHLRHNDVDNSPKSVYARIVLSKLSFCNPSTFCVYPTIASYGKGVVVTTKLYPWVQNGNTLAGNQTFNFMAVAAKYVSAATIASEHLNVESILKKLSG